MEKEHLLRTHQDLDVWKVSMDFVTEIYKVTNDFPKSELFGLSSQIRRASVSIPANISEGSARQSSKEFNHFLHIALGSAAELHTLVLIAKNLEYISDIDSIELTLNRILRMLSGLIRAINK